MEQRLRDLGSSPPHRYGRSRIYGQQLGQILRQQLETRLPTRQPTPEATEHSANGLKDQQTLDDTLAMPLASHNTNNGIFATVPATGISPFTTSELPGANLDVAHMSVDEMAELLKSDYWLPLESNDLFDTSQFFSGSGYDPDAFTNIQAFTAK